MFDNICCDDHNKQREPVYTVWSKEKTGCTRGGQTGKRHIYCAAGKSTTVPIWGAPAFKLLQAIQQL